MKKVKKFDKKNPMILAGLLALCLGVGVFGQQAVDKRALETNSEYVNYEEQQMDLHDGEVLVDSINLTGIPGSNPVSAVPETPGANPEQLLQDSPSSGVGLAEAPSVPDAAPTGADVYLAPVAVVTSDELEGLDHPETYFDEVRATMAMDRNKVMDMLTQVAEEAATEGEKQNATQQKLKLIQYMEQEKTMESLIENKGYAEALVIMTDSSVNVTVNTTQLTQVDAAKICDIVMRETGRSADQIVIQSKS